MTTTKTPLEKPNYEEALPQVEKALLPHLGRDIGKGWVFNGGVPYVTAKDKLLLNLTIQPSSHLNAVEEAEMFHDTGIPTVMEFLTENGIVGLAHYVVRQDERDLADLLRTF